MTLRTFTPTPDILEAIVDLLVFDFEPTSVTDNLDGTYTLTTCNTYHLQPSYLLTIDSVEYTIISVVRNTNIVVSGTTEPPLDTFEIYSPHFYHGVPDRTSAELSKITLTTAKTPMVYLSEAEGDFEETYYGRDSAISRDARLRLFFLTYSNVKDYKTDDYHSKAIVPMTQLANEFIDRCHRSVMIGKFDDKTYTIKPRQNVYIKKSGGNFAGESMSGVELDITLPIKAGNFPCPCNIIVIPTGMTYEDISALTYEQLSALTYDEISA